MAVRVGALLFACLLALAGSGRAGAEPASAPQAMALVKKAVAYYRTHPAQAAYAEFMNPQGPFMQDDLYVVAHDIRTGVNLAHGKEPRVLGQSLLDLRDSEGTYIIRDMIKVANSPGNSGWTEYKWPHPATSKWVLKRTYTEKVGDIMISCGYHPAPAAPSR